LYVIYHYGIGADYGASPNFDWAKYSCARPDRDIATNYRHAMELGSTPNCHIGSNVNIISDDRAGVNYRSNAVIAQYHAPAELDRIWKRNAK
jgi:hypothetical protein